MLQSEAFERVPTMNTTDENRDRFKDLLQEAAKRKGKPIYQMAEEAGVSGEVLRNLLRSGPFVNLKAADLLKVVRYFNLDIGEAASLLGAPLPSVDIGNSRLRSVVGEFEDLSQEEQDWLLGALDVLLRGMRR